MIVLLHNLHLSGFYFGKIQNIIDDREQYLTCILDIQGIILDRIGTTLPQDHFIHPQHRIDRRSYLMRHVG